MKILSGPDRTLVVWIQINGTQDAQNSLTRTNGKATKLKRPFVPLLVVEGIRMGNMIERPLHNRQIPTGRFLYGRVF